MNNTFATAINCMDGRVQKCVHDYVSNKSDAEFVDAITLAGPSKVISEDKLKGVIADLKYRLDISINIHGSSYCVVAGHHDCAGVVEDDETHKEYIKQACMQVLTWYPNVMIEAIWVNDKFEVEVIKF